MAAQCKRTASSTRGPSQQRPAGGYLGLAICDLLRAALFRWMRPLRAARSSREVADFFCSVVADGAFAFFSAVRNAERWARLRTAAARDFRMFFFADAILGTKGSLWLMGRLAHPVRASQEGYVENGPKSRRANAFDSLRPRV